MLRCRPLLISAALPALAGLGILSADPVTVLVETESFDTKGGWKVDTQSVEQMGSVYLIAHGMGKPVADATSSVAFPETGDYRVWVRTRDWVHSASWSAPGRFKVSVDGADLTPEFGTANSNWHWRDGGTVTIPGASAQVALKDLTGFDGRCDAIAFIKGDNNAPPAGGTALKTWRRTVLNETPAPGDVQNYDCVVVGGGLAGCGAAIAAARSGLSVALVQDRPFLGGNASNEIRVASRGEIRHPVVGEIDTFHLDNGHDNTVAEDANRLAVIQAEANITLLMPWRAEDASTGADGRITHVDVRHTHTGARARLQAPLFIDCTGDGWIGYWAGADYRMGREDTAEFGESLAPATADAMTMGNSLMWTSKEDLSGPDTSFPAVPWAMDVAGTAYAASGGWNWEYGMHLDTIEDTEEIRDHLLRAIYGNFYNVKQRPGYEKQYLYWVPFIAGKRESRRLVGDHTLVQSDVQSGLFFEDAVGTATWSIDLHYPTATSYRSTAVHNHVSKWYFPFRCLYSRNVPNLMMAGRCISVSHVGLGSPRVMNTTAQMGVAVGYAAAICNQYGIEPRDIYRSEDRTLELQAHIGGSWPQRPPDNPDSIVVVDNDDPGLGGHFTGTWTSSTSNSGYHGASYMHDGNTGKGTKRAVLVATIPSTGDYGFSLRWTESHNRASNVPVWLVDTTADHTLAADGSAYIRITQPDTSFGGDEMLVGRAAPNDYMRGLLRFDLAGSLPAGAVVLGARLNLTIRERDGSSQAFVGDDGLRVYGLTAAFDPATATWNQRAAGQAWGTPGGDFDPGPLAIISAPADPNAVDAGDVLTFPEDNALSDAVRNAMGGGSLHLVVRTPSIESSFNARKLYRFASAAHANPDWRPKLVVSYCVPGATPDFTVDQRSNGSTWNELATDQAYEIGDKVCVILGTEGTDGYVIADAARFALLGDPPPYPDRDGDLLPDWWERFHFLSETIADPNLDPDHDGRDNYAEFLTGTDPNDPGSFFNLRIALENAAGAHTMSWPSAEGRTYRIEESSDLKTWTPWLEGIPATPPENSQPVTPDSSDPQFFRVGLEEPAGE